MKKVLFLLVIIALSVNALFSDPTEFTGYGVDISSPASTKIHFVYDKKFARIGFTAKELDVSSLNVPDNLSEIILKTDYTTKAATSEAFYAYWQINNHEKEYKINLSSSGLQKEGVIVDSCTWNVSSEGTVVISQSDRVPTLLYDKKTSDTNVNGSKKLVVTIDDYPSLKAGNYILPLKLELVSLWKVFLISLLSLSLFSLSAEPSVQVLNGNQSSHTGPSVNLKLNMKNTAKFHMGFTNSTVIGDSVVSVTQINLIPEFYGNNTDYSQFNLRISKETKTIRGYWNIFGNIPFVINIELSKLVGSRYETKSLGWCASWEDGSKKVTATGGGEAVLFYAHTKDSPVEDVGSRLITFDLTDTRGSYTAESLVVDKYTGTITMEVKTLS